MKDALKFKIYKLKLKNCDESSNCLIGLNGPYTLFTYIHFKYFDSSCYDVTFYST